MRATSGGRDVTMRQTRTEQLQIAVVYSTGEDIATRTDMLTVSTALAQLDSANVTAGHLPPVFSSPKQMTVADIS